MKGTGSSPIVASVEGTKEEMAERLLSYQNFMAKYIVESHQQKVAAVKAAERKTIFYGSGKKRDEN